MRKNKKSIKYILLKSEHENQNSFLNLSKKKPSNWNHVHCTYYAVNPELT